MTLRSSCPISHDPVPAAARRRWRSMPRSATCRRSLPHVPHPVVAGRPRDRAFSTASSTARAAASGAGASAASSPSSCWSAPPRRLGWAGASAVPRQPRRRGRRGGGWSASCWRSAASSSMSPRSPRRCDRGGLPAGREAVAPHRRPRSRAASTSMAWRAPRSKASPRISATASWRRCSGICCSGLPGLFAYKMANTLDSMIGHRSPRYRAFGWAAARFDDLAQPGAGAAQRRCCSRAAALFAARRDRRRRRSRSMLRDGAQAPLAQCRLARGGDGRRARPRARRPAPLCRGRWSAIPGSATARRGRRRPTSRARCGSTRSPACCWPASSLGAG